MTNTYINVTVSLQEKRSIYQAVMYYKTKEDKPKHVWRSTGIKIVKGQKKELRKQAEVIAEQYRVELEKDLNKSCSSNDILKRQDMLFSDYLVEWLDSISNALAKTTIGGYQSNINAIIAPYFKEKSIRLSELTTLDLQDFYDNQYKLGKSARTVKHYHNNIHQALEKARKTKLIVDNPSDDCDLKKPQNYIPEIYNCEELQTFLNKVKGTDIEVPIILIAVYGFRKSEALRN